MTTDEVAAKSFCAGALAFEPWTAWTNSTVDEAIPSATAPVAASTTVPTPSATPDAPVELARGTFVSQEHGTSGTARILEGLDGSRSLRLEGFATSNGPDLHVWLSDRSAGGDWFKYDEGASIQLGELKANRGSHNYAIPADAELTDVESVVIWCKRFRVAFGSAPLKA